MLSWIVALPRSRLGMLYCASLGATAGTFLTLTRQDRCDAPPEASSPSPAEEWSRVGTPSQSSCKYLIAGGGVAAASALQELYEKGSGDDRIVLVTPSLCEDGLESRVRLKEKGAPRGLLSSIGLGPAQLKSPSVELLVGRSVRKLDPVSRTASLDTGEKITFDKCLLAFGGDVVRAEEAMLQRCVAPNARDFCSYVQTCQERVDGLLSAERSTHAEPPHVTVVGGSWSSASLAARLLHRGASVTVSYSEPAFLARHFPKYLSEELYSRFRYLSDTTDVNFDTLSYSALKYVTRSEVPPRFRCAPLGQAARTTEATVHMSLVFDAYDLVQFRTDLVVFSPTLLPAPQVLRNAQTDDQGLLIASPELSVYSDVFAAGACLADAPGNSKTAASWSTLRASETGSHAARNMLGGREPYVRTVPAFEVDLNPVGVRLMCVGEQDGSNETFGYYLRSRDRGDSTCGGEIVAGVLYYATSQKGQMRVTGVCVWDGERCSGRLPSKEVLDQCTDFLKTRGDYPSGTVQSGDADDSDDEDDEAYSHVQAIETSVEAVLRDRNGTEQDLRAFAKKLLLECNESDNADAADMSGDIDGDKSESTDGNKPSGMGPTFTTMNRPARNVRIREREVMFVGDEKLGATTGTSPKDKRAVAFDALLRRSMQN